MKKIFLSFVFLFFLFSHFVHATSIRDSEIEETFNLILKPLSKSANLQKNIKIHILMDDTLNAFTDGFANIYICSGLITKFKDINVIRGVIAHEIGHISGKHVIRLNTDSEGYAKFASSSIALGLIGALSGKISYEAMTAIALGGRHIAERSVLSYSRSYESFADQIAIKILEGNGYSIIGMIDFFRYILSQSNDLNINPYEQTHPISKDRIHFLRTHFDRANIRPNITNIKSGDQSEEQLEKSLQYKFARSCAKLDAFVIKNPNDILSNTISQITTIHATEIDLYRSSIAYFRIGNMNMAINCIDQLLQIKPNDPFYNELKGQILFEFGKKESLAFYEKALQIRPKDPLLRMSRAIIGINIYINADSRSLNLSSIFADDLKFALEADKTNTMALYYLSMYYDIIGKKSESLLYLALMEKCLGNSKRSVNLAKQSLDGLKNKSPEWYKAQDIVEIKNYAIVNSVAPR